MGNWSETRRAFRRLRLAVLDLRLALAESKASKLRLKILGVEQEDRTDD